MNPIKEKIRARQLTLGTMVFEFNTPGIGSILAQAQAEFAVFDMEHSGFGIDSIRQLMSYCRGLNIVPMVRIPDTQYVYMARALDVGAKGIMVPLVQSRDQVQKVIAACKYYPLGQRGNAFGVAHDNFSVVGDPSATMLQENDDTIIVVQIETEAGLDHLEDIVTTEGVDVAWVGHFDLSWSMGIPGQVNHPRIQAAMDRVAEVCQRHGKAAARMVSGVDDAVHWSNRGYTCLAYSGDIWLLQQALSSGLTQIRRQVQQEC